MVNNMRNFCIALIAAVVLCLAAPAFAGNDGQNECGNNGNNCVPTDGGGGNNGGPGTNGAGGVATATATAAATANSDASATGGNATATGGSSSLGDASFGNVRIDSSDQSSYTYKERKQPVASAAPVFATACSSGVSAQSFGFGGSLASTNPMCDLALAAEMARAGGDEELSRELMLRAAKYARARSNVMRRWSQYLPIIGNIY